MGVSLMVCTWNVTDYALDGCDNSEQSYREVANMYILNAKLEVLETVLTVSLLRPTLKCLTASSHLSN